MTRAEYEALALRVEREEPSRKLDAAISAVSAPAGCQLSPASRYTSSLDAAASLMPPGWRIHEISHKNFGLACVLYHPDAGLFASGFAPDEKRARTAAALRACAQEASDDQ